MIIPKQAFFQLYGQGQPSNDFDLEAMDYGSTDDRRVLLALARAVRPSTVIEFGIQRGMTAQMLLAEVPGVRKYVGVDIPSDESPVLPGQHSEVPVIAGELVIDDRRVTVIQKNSRELTAKDLPQADLIYIDGGHDYETVAHDTGLARRCIRPGGMIVWHDYGNGTVEVTQLIDSLNRAEGNHICLVEGTWVCFQMASTVAEGVTAE